MAPDALSKLLPKLHLRLMPTLLMMYVLAFLDRANVGFAEVCKTVYLTGSTSIYRLHSKIAGEIPMYYRK